MQVFLLAWTPPCAGGPVPFMFNMPIRAEEQDGVYADGIKTLGRMFWRDLHIHALLTFVNPTKLLARITQLNKFWMYYDNILSLGPMRSLLNSLLRWLHGVLTPEVQAIHKTTTNNYQYWTNTMSLWMQYGYDIWGFWSSWCLLALCGCISAIVNSFPNPESPQLLPVHFCPGGLWRHGYDP